MCSNRVVAHGQWCELGGAASFFCARPDWLPRGCQEEMQPVPRHRPNRLAVRTSRCGRDNPGSNPGSDIFAAGARPKGTNVEKWRRRGSNPGPSACEADVIPLHHIPVAQYVFIFSKERLARSCQISLRNFTRQKKRRIPPPGLEPGSFG